MQSKYKQIYHDYVRLIEQGQLHAGDALPSESNVMAQYRVSRDTVRKAMTLLEHNHFIVKQRGRESLVLDRSKYAFPIAKIMSFAELAAQQGWHSETEVVDVSVIVGEETIMEKLKLTEADEVYRVVRVRRIDGERIILDRDYFVRDIVPHLSRATCSGSIYAYLEGELGLRIGHARKVVTVQQATSEDRLLLDLHEADRCVAVVTSYTHLSDGTLFQYTESRHRVDKFQFEEYAQR